MVPRALKITPCFKQKLCTGTMLCMPFHTDSGSHLSTYYVPGTRLTSLKKVPLIEHLLYTRCCVKDFAE